MTMQRRPRTQSNPHTNSQHDKGEGKSESTRNFLESQEHNRVQTLAIAMTEQQKCKQTLNEHFSILRAKHNSRPHSPPQTF